MQLILLQNVQNLGQLGDKVTVKPGYGRNFLVPQGKATPATAANLAEFEARRAEYEARARQLNETAESRRAALEGVEVTIRANASTEGKLYGSITTRDVADALTRNGHEVSKSEVVMGEGPIRQAGEYEILLQLHAGIEATVKLIVEGELA
ncbi:50S ribosomal protein L9 [Lysobacter sp. GX 14042]|uniref:50S ribosomal protein L9 n=1 Tax=Lysobacter sp. GX 14042 TaxID=2907155 RepID=UPI001F40CB57|nr:50S ribosomal protein L9 [Lysobacter sp. GX 14042]MCE7031295.1 50S ribosomal protein L9 [Lysobacter sp. GX 14042]